MLFSTMGRVENLYSDLGVRGQGSVGNKMRVKMRCRFGKGSSARCWPHGERVTPERLVREIRVGTSVNSS